MWCVHPTRACFARSRPLTLREGGGMFALRTRMVRMGKDWKGVRVWRGAGHPTRARFARSRPLTLREGGGRFACELGC